MKVVSLLAVVLAFGLSSRAFAAATSNQPPASLDAYNKAVAETGKSKTALIAAKDEVAKSESELNKVVTQLKHEFDTSSEWTSAQSDLKQAQDEFNAAKAPVLQTLQAKPDYVAAKRAKDKAEAQRDELAGSEKATPDEKSAAASAVLAAGNTMTKLESDALAQDAATITARRKMLEATNKITKLNSEFEASVKSNATWTSAKQKLDDSRKKLAEADTAYGNAQKAQVAALTQYQTDLKAKADAAKKPAGNTAVNTTTPRK